MLIHATVAALLVTSPTRLVSVAASASFAPAVASALVCDAASPASVTSASLLPSAPQVVADTALDALYRSGESFEAFLANAKSRREMWVKNWEASRVPEDALAQALALPGRWRLLVSAVDGCSDSVNTVPYLARLVSLVPALEMRIVQPGPGRPIMERHRTPDGRAATPTIVILDAEGNEVGCWIERPLALQAMAMKARADGQMDGFARGKQDWYDTDAGASTIREVVRVLAAAAAGAPLCPLPQPPEQP